MRLLDTERFIDKVIIVFQIKFLKLLGLMPQLEFCVNCDTKLTGSMSADFSLKSAGLICNRCSDATLQSFAISNGAVASMRVLAKTQPHGLGRISISSRLREEISNLLNRFIDYQLGEHLKSARFIRAVGAVS